MSHTEYESILSKARKVAELAERGIQGEAESAKRKLEAIMQKYGLTLDDIGTETKRFAAKKSGGKLPTKLNKMNKQLNLFETVNEATKPACFLGAVMRSAFVDSNVIRTEKWQEFHANGQLWIDGEIALIKEQYKGLCDCRDGWYDARGCDDLRNGKYLIPKGQPVVRIGVWTKYYDNGQIAWQIDYGDGMYDSRVKRQSFPAYRKDGTAVVY